MFQPGEEMHDGAALMIAEGVLDAAGRRADAAYAIHAFAATVPGGHVVSRRGAMLAAADGFEVVVEGRGGHGSAPQHALDPVPVACEIVMALQTMTTRRFDVFDPVVVTVGSLRAGDAPTSSPRTPAWSPASAPGPPRPAPASASSPGSSPGASRRPTA